MTDEKPEEPTAPSGNSEEVAAAARAVSGARDEALSEIRMTLDRIDRQIVDALAERQECISQVARVKDRKGLQLRDPSREAALLSKLVARGQQTGLDANFIIRLYREVLEHSLRLQQEFLVAQRPGQAVESGVVVSYQGAEGAYSYLAACRHFETQPGTLLPQGYNTFRQILEAVKNEVADYAMLPIENTTAGSINEAYDLLAEMDLVLVGEEIQPVRHCLIALDSVPVENVRRVYSHPQALAQCSVFLGSLEHCHQEAFTDTAMAVQKIRDERDLSQAAIASEQAAQLYGLQVIKRDIANQRENFTRFVVAAKEAVQYDTRISCKTSLILATRHEEGALAKCLSVLTEHHLNLTKLESRPRPRTPWEYLFYVDFEGNLAEASVQRAIQRLSAHASYLKVLGSYPARNLRSGREASPPKLPLRAEATLESGGLARTSIPALNLYRKPYRLASRHHRNEDSVVNISGVSVGGGRSFVVAGPPVVRDTQQVAACAKQIKVVGGALLTGGCFGPTGLGYRAVEMLVEAGTANGLPVLVEVRHHADVANLTKTANALEIGPEFMRNIELLEAVGRRDRPVILHRGPLASIDEWLTAAERILRQGNQQVVLCESGIRTFDSDTPATLDLSAIPILRERTHLPIIVDPARACGQARWAVPLARAALACGSDGLIIAIDTDLPDLASAQNASNAAIDLSDFADFMGGAPASSDPSATGEPT